MIITTGRPGGNPAGQDHGRRFRHAQVQGLVPGHGGQVLQRARGAGTGGQPLEIQLLEFPSARALDAFMTDWRRQSLAGERDRVISKTELIEVKLVPPCSRTMILTAA